MTKFIKRAGQVAAGLVLLLIVGWIIVALLIAFNKDLLRSKLINVIATRTGGEVTVDRVSASFFETFPFISIEIQEVRIRDSLFHVHKHELFHAKRVYLRVSPLSLLTSDKIGKIIIKGGGMYLFTDSSGYTNNYLLKQDNKEQVNQQPSVNPPPIRLENFNVELSNPANRKHYKGHINSLNTKFSRSDITWSIDLNIDIQLTGLGFNVRKGYFLVDSRVRSNMRILLEDSAKNLSFNNHVFIINKERLVISGLFTLDDEHNNFELKIVSANSDYRELSKLMPGKIQKQLNRFSISKGVDINVSIKGTTARGSDPRVVAVMIARKKSVHTPDLDLTNCSFEGTFDNQADSTKETGDANTLLTFKKLSASVEGIPVSAEQTSFHDLGRTYMRTDIHADIPLASLNKQFGSTTFRLNGGRALINAKFEGPITGNDSTTSKVNGYIRFRNGSITYLPRSIDIRQLNGDLLFKEKNLVVPGLTMSTGKSSVRLEGQADNFLSLFNISPEKLFLSWNVSSDAMYLEDYRTFLGKRASSNTDQKKQTALSKAGTRIDKMFTDGNVHLTLTTKALHYRKFNASTVRAAILLSNDYVDLENVSLNHAGGSIALKGRMTQGTDLNKLVMSAELARINVPEIFDAFSDFGQDAITSKNLKGVLTASINLESYISDQAKMATDKTSGRIRFLLQQGELHQFEPVEKISQKAMKKQDFSDIRFADLENEFEIKGTAFIINKMEIRSTAITMFVEGVYDTKKGTDMSIQLPVRNLLKSNADADLSDAGKDRKGISVRLRAQTGANGKLQVGWDPFKKAVKNKEAMAE